MNSYSKAIVYIPDEDDVNSGEILWQTIVGPNEPEETWIEMMKDGKRIVIVEDFYDPINSDIHRIQNSEIVLKS